MKTARAVTCPLVIVATCLLEAVAVAQGASAAGRWKTVDDRTGQAKSIVVIEDVGGEYRGRVDRIFAPPAKEANPLCENCPGDKKNKPVLGMEIMWGLKKSRNGNEYTGGRIMDPEDGKIYRCRLRVVDGGTKLEVRGYIGFSLIGRTQTWVRE
jgi:uncharacterized protein (DUF2147 family)